MGEKELIPAIRFKGFTDPWEQRKLGDLGSAYSGMTGKSRHDFGHGDARYITYLNVFSQPLLNDQIELGLTPVDRKQTEVKSGDALFTISSEVPEEIAISAVWQSTRENVYLNSFCFGVRPYRSCDSVYFAYALRSPSVRVSFMLLAQGISRYNISKLRALDVLLPWPSEDEQNNVGSFFARADRLITLHQRKLEKLQRMKQALLEKLFPKNGAVVPELRFNGFTDAWEQRKISNYLQESKIEGGSGDVAQKLTVKLWGKGVVKKNDYGGSKSTKYFRREAGQFIYSKLDFLNGAFGVIPNELAGYESTADLPAFDVTSLNAKYLLLFVSQEKFYIKQGMIADGSRKAKRIHVGTFLTMPVLVPTLEEQNVIVATFNELESLIALHQRKLEKLQQLKSAFLTKMFV